AGAGALFFARLAFYQRAEIPSAIRQLGAFDVRPHEPYAADHRPLVDELADAVAERDLVDVNQRPAVARERDVSELQAAEERPFEAADRQRRGEIVVRLADDQFADPVLCPPGSDRRDREADDHENESDDDDERSREPRRDVPQSSEPCHLRRAYQCPCRKIAEEMWPAR